MRTLTIAAADPVKNKTLNLPALAFVLAVTGITSYLFVDWLTEDYDDYANPLSPEMACAKKIKDEPRLICMGGEIYQIADAYEKYTLITMGIN